MSKLHILALSGSLRAGSSNTSLLRALVSHPYSDAHTTLFDELESVPAFNPDRESEAAPPSVAALRSGIARADLVVFSTPEYAHGVPGALKNALDWLVGSSELYRKPVALLKVSARGDFAHASLKETLAIMGAKLVRESIVDPSSASLAEDLRKEILEWQQEIAAIPPEL